jgi:hyperosmotically inducible periplasmic protein
MNVRRIPLLAAAAVLGLAACDQVQQQPLDAATTRVEQNAGHAGAAAKQDLARAGTMDAGAMKAKDATITTAVQAELARDAALSAAKIDVATVEGRVSLRGTVPDAAALERAQQLAQRVEGVVSVANQLQVGG